MRQSVPCYVLLALASDTMKQHVTVLLEKLSQELPGILWTMPPEQLHITIYSIIEPKEYAEEKEVLFADHESRYVAMYDHILTHTPALTVTFDCIEASRDAIIIRASNSKALNALRSTLTATIELPSETRTPPDITHSSIARYTRRVDLNTVQKIVERHAVSFDEMIADLSLMKIDILPLEHYRALHHYSLQQDS